MQRNETLHRIQLLYNVGPLHKIFSIFLPFWIFYFSHFHIFYIKPPLEVSLYTVKRKTYGQRLHSSNNIYMKTGEWTIKLSVSRIYSRLTGQAGSGVSVRGPRTSHNIRQTIDMYHFITTLKWLKYKMNQTRLILNWIPSIRDKEYNKTFIGVHIGSLILSITGILY